MRNRRSVRARTKSRGSKRTALRSRHTCGAHGEVWLGEGSTEANVEPPENLLAVYAVLFARQQSTGALTFQVVGLTAGAQAAIWVGLSTVHQSPLMILLGCGLLLLGNTAAFVVRSAELSSMLDRQLLDVYEEQMGVPATLLTHHGRRFEDRFQAVTKELSPGAKKRVFRRRVELASGGRAWRSKADRWLSRLGQPSLVWTFVLAGSGTAGFGVAIGETFSSVWAGIVAALVGVAPIVFPWIAAGLRHGE